ncbi:hypothetical protein GCK72_009922 [Caenorhabditis remanei]|uniref:Uncharacterized protein n=1 Tax=Caenorhabditis remanei TaxID=31234 RepID=A0A6A5H479_CAERE|nr:hypothetical protein GCK72_009922 [Caenorhabditis remanei]KAF1761666.1 hypothetical protein GCK72_009922 [Caenorhabditis remanei]
MILLELLGHVSTDWMIRLRYWILEFLLEEQFQHEDFHKNNMPQWFRLNIYQDQLPQMTDCSCLNICLPCQSCSFRRLLNGCFPRLNLKQRFNCTTTCCTRPGPDKLNLVCCVV